MSEIYFWVLSGIPFALLFAFHKRLRNGKFFWIASSITFGILVLGIVIQEVLLLLPFLFTIVYATLRKLYIFLFGWEPIVVFYYACNNEDRKCGLPDFIFSLCILLIPIILIFYV